MTPDTWGASDTPCTCNYGGTHDTANPECDRAILDGTAAPTFYAVNPAEHPMHRLDVEGEAAKCMTCGVTVIGDHPFEIHMRDLRRRKA